jgi:hypothetical protein
MVSGHTNRANSATSFRFNKPWRWRRIRQSVAGIALHR